MNERSLVTTMQLKPYTDESGFQYKVSVSEFNGMTEIRIDDISNAIDIAAEDWPVIRDAIADMLFFAERSKPKDPAHD